MVRIQDIFGKGKPIKAYFVAKGIEHIYDVKQEYWDKNKKKSLVKEVPIMPSLILFRTTRTEAEEIERKFLNKVMLYRGKILRTWKNLLKFQNVKWKSSIL